MRYSFRTLVILTVVGPPFLAGWMVVKHDPFQLFLAFGFVAYFLFAVAVAWAVACAFEVVKKLL
jgi:hypothetical protein